MTNPIAAALLCAALGAWYAHALGADARRRELECRAAQGQAVEAMELAADRLAEAGRLIGLCEVVTRTWRDTADWYQRAYLEERR